MLSGQSDRFVHSPQPLRCAVQLPGCGSIKNTFVLQIAVLHSNMVRIETHIPTPVCRVSQLTTATLALIMP